MADQKVHICSQDEPLRAHQATSVRDLIQKKNQKALYSSSTSAISESVTEV